MSAMHCEDTLRNHLQQVIDLLDKQQLVEELTHRELAPRRHELVESLVHKQHQTMLKQKLDQLHAADIAYILEALPLHRRLAVWDLVKSDLDGEILLNVSDAVRESLLSAMDRNEIRDAVEYLDTDEIADLAAELPHEVAQQLLESLNDQIRAQVESLLAYPEDSVARLMDMEMVTVRDDIELGVVLRYLRRRGELPEHTDKLFVVNKQNTLLGALPIQRLLFHNPETLVAEVMLTDQVVFQLDDDAEEAAHAFERYDLLSAPVVDANRKLQGRIRVDVILDYVRERSDDERLNQAGLREDEDLFAGVWRSLKNRWVWLAVNLITAFLSTRVIGLFEGTIAQIVALASLMPIVAGLGGNTGTQTSMLIVRSLALGQIRGSNLRNLIFKEMTIGLLNGVVWGSVIGVVTFALYQNLKIGLVMAAAVLLNLMVAATVGLTIPLIRHRMNLDPALGVSVLLTAITDGMGFFIFLGLATVFLL